jgi:predicted outer membrane repeat protein
MVEALEDREVPAIYTVTDPGNAGPGTLRWAITQANNDVGTSDTIEFDATKVPGAVTITAQLPEIIGPVAIVGLATGNTSIERSSAAGTPQFSVLWISTPAGRPRNLVTISNLAIRNGDWVLDGGGIRLDDAALVLDRVIISDNRAAAGGGIGLVGVEPSLTITNSVIRDNVSTVAYGGGISTGQNGLIVISDSTIRGNTAETDGGGIATGKNVRVWITKSTIKDNTAKESGGGISNGGRGMTDWGFDILSSTFSNNSALGMGDAGKGGAIDNNGSARLRNTTISGNYAKSGAGIYARFFPDPQWGTNQNTLEIKNSTVADNSVVPLGIGGGLFIQEFVLPKIANSLFALNVGGDAPDIGGMVLSLGHNLVGDGSGGLGFLPSDLVGTAAFPIDPVLSVLGDYGGPTQTHILLAGSPALDAGDNALIDVLHDQRGLTRIVNGTVDIGAVEMQSGEGQSSLVISALQLPKPKKGKVK